jgi:hypothetical protein
MMKKVIALLFGLMAMMMPAIAQDNPMVRVEVKNCWRDGNYVWMGVVLNNYSGQDKTVLVYNSYHGDKTTAVYDANHNEYDYAMVINNEYQDLSINNFQHIDCPNGTPVKFDVIATNVPASAKTIGRLNVSVDRYVTPFLNVKIKESEPNTNMENITCNSCDLTFDYQECERNGENLIVSFKMKTKENHDFYFKWNTSKFGIYDDSGNKYGWSLNMAGMSNGGEVKVPAQTPVAGKLTIKKVPASVTELTTVLMPMLISRCDHQFAHEVRMSGLKVGQKPGAPQGLSALFGQQDENGPKAILRKCMTAMANGDVKTMLSYDIDYVKADAAAKARQEAGYAKQLEKLKGSTFTIGEQKEDPSGNYNAIVDVVVKTPDGQTIPSPVPLVKVNGKWFIKLSS